MSSDTLRKSYDDVPYPELPYSQTHPDRLATLAIILGLQPAPVTNCRVLELGCARGANIIPMAYGLPNSEFVGIDFSAKQVNSGQIAITSLGLQNIKVVQADILSLTDDIVYLTILLRMEFIHGRLRLFVKSLWRFAKETWHPTVWLLLATMHILAGICGVRYVAC